MELETDEETIEKFAPNDEEAEVDNVICKEIDNDAFNVEEFAKVLGSATTMRKRLQDNVEKNIITSQVYQKRQYNRRHEGNHKLQVGEKVLLINMRRNERKGGWMDLPKTGPYTIEKVIDGKTVVLKNEAGQVLKKKYPLKQLVKFYETIPIEENKRNRSQNKEKKCKSKETSQNRDDNLKFHPVDSEWQTDKASSLKLSITKITETKATDKTSLTNPLQVIDTVGDGNCFFRAISIVLTGTEENHMLVRKQLINFMTINQVVKDFVAEDIANYVNRTKMDENKTWATDVEIFAMAIYLKTDIVVFSQGNWQRFSKTGFLKDINFDSKNIYLENVNRNHYTVVQSVH